MARRRHLPGGLVAEHLAVGPGGAVRAAIDELAALVDRLDAALPPALWDH